MRRQLLFEAAARDEVLRGATWLASAVRVTLGPKPKCVLIDRRWGEPLVCNDGVTIAKALELDGPTESLGARMIRQAAGRTGQGDQAFDAARSTWADLVQEGIVDATKVVRLALESAVSVASVQLLTEATLAEVPEPQAAPQPVA